MFQNNNIAFQFTTRDLLQYETTEDESSFWSQGPFIFTIISPGTTGGRITEEIQNQRRMLGIPTDNHDGNNQYYVYLNSKYLHSCWETIGHAGNQDANKLQVCVIAGKKNTMIHLYQNRSIIAASSTILPSFYKLWAHPETNINDYSYCIIEDRVLFAQLDMTTASHVLTTVGSNTVLEGDDRVLTVGIVLPTMTGPVVLVQGNRIDVHLVHPVVEIDGSVITNNYTSSQPLIDSIGVLCNSIDPTKFEGMGTLVDYRALVLQAVQIQKDTRLVVCNGLQNINLEAVQGVMNDISQCLANITVTLKTSITVDDTNILLQIKQYLTSMIGLQTALQEFKIQIGHTADAILPASLDIVTQHLTICKPKIEGVMAYMNHFVNIHPCGEMNNGEVLDKDGQIVYSAMLANLSPENEATINTGLTTLKRIKSDSTRLTKCLTDVLPIRIGNIKQVQARLRIFGNNSCS